MFKPVVSMNDKNYRYPLSTFAVSLAIFILLEAAGSLMHTPIGQVEFLSFHTLFEFVSILFSFSIFTVVFYIYKENSYSMHIILASTFLISGLVDIFHTLSYRGMPDFFTPSSAPKATAFWVISRLIMAVGFLGVALIRKNKVSRISRWAVLSGSCIVSLGIFFIVTYHPYLIPEFYIDGQGLTPAKIRTEYAIIALQVITIIFSLREYRLSRNKTWIIFSTALIVNIFSELCFTLYISVYDIYNFIGHIYKIIAYSIMFNIIFVQNIRLPYQRLKAAETLLKNHSKTLEREIEKTKAEMRETNKKLFTDIEYAMEIQQSMLPERKLQYGSVKICSALIPCGTLSGDFFNVFEIDEDNIGMYLVDVSGHGISSAIMTIFTDRTVMSNKLDAYKQQLLLSPSMILKDLFQLYNNSKFPAEMYLLMFYGVYNRTSGVFTYSSAGLNTPPIIISGSKLKTLNSRGAFPICKMGEYFRPKYTDSRLRLKPGDRVVLYSDGLIEALNRDGVAFGSERLMDILANNSSVTVEELYFEVFDRFSCFVLDRKLEDDMTLLIMQV